MAYFTENMLPAPNRQSPAQYRSACNSSKRPFTPVTQTAGSPSTVKRHAGSLSAWCCASRGSLLTVNRHAISPWRWTGSLLTTQGSLLTTHHTHTDTHTHTHTHTLRVAQWA